MTAETTSLKLMTPHDADLFWELQSERQHRRYGWLLRLHDLRQRFRANDALMATMAKDTPSEPYCAAVSDLHNLYDQQGRLFNEIWGTLMGEQPDLISRFVEGILFEREKPNALEDQWWEA